MATRKRLSAQLLDLPPSDIDKMSEKELRKVVSTLASTANKRLKELSKSAVTRESPAYKSAMARSYTGRAGGKFGTEGKNVNQLRNEFKAVREFLQSGTSSVQKFARTKKKVYKRIGGDFGGDVDKEKAFWSIYRKLEELYPEKSAKYGSTEIQVDLHQIMSDSNAKNVMKKINEANVSQKRKNRDKYIEDLTEKGYILNEKHRRVKVDPTDTEDVIMIMGMRLGIEYERENALSESDEFFAI